MSKRRQNEGKFPHWIALTDGGRRYWREVAGQRGWRARYVKIVDADEETLTFRQEIFDASGRLVEVHQIFPVDTGHQAGPFEESDDDYA